MDQDSTRKAAVREAAKQHRAGEGLAKSAKDTGSVFRALNFELFAKPNLKVAVPGTIVFVGCMAYCYYMKMNADDAVKKGTHYVEYTEDGKWRMGLSRGSKWD